MRERESDRGLVQACMAGDRGAWEALIRRYERLLYAVPLRCGLSEEEAADVFQTVCIRLYENLETLRNQERLSAWLITTANRESWRIKRQGQRTTSLSDPEPEAAGERRSELAVDPGALPQETVLRLEQEQMVREGLRELDERCRRLLVALYFSDPAPTYAEIAREMGSPEGAIGPTRARCLGKLRKILERNDY